MPSWLLESFRRGGDIVVEAGEAQISEKLQKVIVLVSGQSERRPDTFTNMMNPQPKCATPGCGDRGRAGARARPIAGCSWA
jgi:hypothetical protein